MCVLSRRQFFARTLVAAAGASAFGGCKHPEKKYPARGKVVYKDNGEPVPAGYLIWLESTTPPYQRAWAPIEKDGTFVLSTEMESVGVIQGEHRVRFGAPFNSIGNPVDLLGKVMPRRYYEYSTSDLKVNIQPQQNDLVIEVDRPEEPAGKDETAK